MVTIDYSGRQRDNTSRKWVTHEESFRHTHADYNVAFKVTYKMQGGTNKSPKNKNMNA